MIENVRKVAEGLLTSTLFWALERPAHHDLHHATSMPFVILRQLLVFPHRLGEVEKVVQALCVLRTGRKGMLSQNYK